MTAPGVYDDMPDAEYHASPALSTSGVKRLLPPSCPALFDHERRNGRPEKRAYDVGHAVHALVLGKGAQIVPVDAPDWRSKAAREERDAAYAAGITPLLLAEYEAAKAAAAAVMAHPIAGKLFTDGIAEQSLFWHDEQHNVMRRARPDWRTTLPDGRPVVVDLKTCRSAEPRAISKAVHEYRYHCQQSFYTDGLRALGIADDPAWLFVFVETAAPHLVTVCELDVDTVEVGARLVQQALETFAECTANDTWPGYTPADDIPLISLPSWAFKESA